MILEKPIAFLDLETTGTDIKNDRILEISICKLHPNGDRKIKTRRFNPGRPIPYSATQIHGIKDEDVKDQPPFKSLAKGIFDFITGCDIGGYNSNNFDIPMLYEEFFRSGLRWDYSETNFIDPCNIFKRKEERTLAAAVKFYTGKELDNAHSAEADINATVDVFLAQLQRYDDLPETAKELDLYCNYDKRRIDLAGWFGYDDLIEHKVLFRKGKHVNEPLNNSYLNWMAYLSDFMPTDSREHAKNFMTGGGILKK